MEKFTYISVAIIFVIIVICKIISHLRFRKKRLSINKKLEEKLKETNFNVTKTISIRDSRTFNSIEEEDKQKIFVDAENQKLFLTNYSKEKFHTIDFADIVDAEIYETSAISGERKRRDINEYCNSLKLIIKIDNMDMPQITYDSGLGRKIDKEGNMYRGLRGQLQEVKSFFDVISAEKTSKKTKFVFCKYCGTKNSEEAPKCSSCGGDLK